MEETESRTEVRVTLPEGQQHEIKPWSATPLLSQVTLLGCTGIVSAIGLPRSMATGDRLLIMSATTVPALLIVSLFLGWKRETRGYIVPIACFLSTLLSTARFLLFDF